ncbi:MAG: substrate-binding domain-containing protein [Gammaproteobacteria bacterium]|nr:substrate-binding domain-containing protein [Gammaproteobacteria bacterium]
MTTHAQWRGILLALACALLATTVADATQATREGRNTDFVTVCGDSNNLPFSNDRMEGFENRIAALIAENLARPLRYRWWPQTMGFIRNTLRTRLCDLVMGVTSVNELVQNSNPYYRSVYALVQRNDDSDAVDSLADPRLKSMKLGVIAGTPPATLLTRYGLMPNTRSYQRTVDTRHFSPTTQAVEDVATGETDVAIIWGPIAGYLAKRHDPPLRMTPLPANVDGVQLAFSVSMGMRHREKQWKHEINSLIESLRPELQAILLDYDVPLLDSSDHRIMRSGTATATP